MPDTPQWSQNKAQSPARRKFAGRHFCTDPLWTLEPEPFCAQPRAMLSAPPGSSTAGPLSSPGPSDSAPRLQAPQPPSTQVPASPAPSEDPQRPLGSRTHLSSLSDMTPAPQRPGSAPHTRARRPTNCALPPRTAPRFSAPAR